MDARLIFTTAYGKHSRNFMTPRRLEIGTIVRGCVAYELSVGEGFSNNTIYGVSVALVDPETGEVRKADGPVSKCLNSRTAAENYIDWLRDNWPTWTNDFELFHAKIDAEWRR